MSGRSPGSPPAGATSREPEEVELVIARLLLAGAVVGVALLAVGVALMAANGIDPLASSFPAFDAGRVLRDLAGFRPEGFLWAGIVILIATPIARVVGELAVFSLRGDRIMSGVALAILGVVALSVVSALLLEG